MLINIFILCSFPETKPYSLKHQRIKTVLTIRQRSFRIKQDISLLSHLCGGLLTGIFSQKSASAALLIYRNKYLLIIGKNIKARVTVFVKNILYDPVIGKEIIIRNIRNLTFHTLCFWNNTVTSSCRFIFDRWTTGRF